MIVNCFKFFRIFFDWKALIFFNAGGEHTHPCMQTDSFLLFPYGSQIRRSMAKLELYRKFTNSLAVSVLLSVAWIGYEVPCIFLFLSAIL